MKALIIGGTGVISSYVVKRLVEKKWDVWVLNRGSKKERKVEGVNEVILDINDTDRVNHFLRDKYFDTVSNFVAYKRSDVERDYMLFRDKTQQYIFTSSASVYLKPCASYIINEGTRVQNKFWQYSRDKIECENYLKERSAKDDFNLTIVRPSHTYSEYSIPLALHGKNGSWQVIKRMKEGKRVVVPGDGTSLWTLTHSKDFALGYVGLMGNKCAYNDDFNITGREVLTWDEIHSTISSSLGVEYKPYYVSSSFLSECGDKYGYDFKGTLLGDKANSLVFDTRKIERVVPEMRTTVLFHEGIRESIKYYEENVELQKDDEKFDLFCDRTIEALEKAKEEI